MAEIDTVALERVVLNMIHHGSMRCGSGFGKYPLGVLYAVEELSPLIPTPAIQDALAKFKTRLGV